MGIDDPGKCPFRRGKTAGQDHDPALVCAREHGAGDHQATVFRIPRQAEKLPVAQVEVLVCRHPGANANDAIRVGDAKPVQIRGEGLLPSQHELGERPLREAGA